MSIARFKDLCLDATDPAGLGPFWAEVLGLTWHVQEGGDGELHGATPQHTIWINRVPEPKTVKNRVHWDVTVPAVQPLIDAGATLLRPPGGDHWHVMADPEGNEFCAFTE